MKLEDFGLKPLEHIELPTTGEPIIAMIHGRSFEFIGETKEAIYKYEGYVLAYGEVDGEKEGHYFLESSNIHDGEYTIPFCGYTSAIDEHSDTVGGVLDIDDDRETIWVNEDAIVAYYKLKAVTEFITDGKGMNGKVVDWWMNKQE